MSSASKQSKLGTLQTLNVLSGAECAFLLTLENNEGFTSTIPGVFAAIQALSEATMQGKLDETAFSLMDRSGELMKFHEKRFMQGWSPRAFVLSGTCLEHSSKKGSSRTNIINLTPECFVVESSLKDSIKRHAFTLVTPRKVLQLACPSFPEKMCWIGSLARAILVPRKQTLGLYQSSLFRGSLSLELQGKTVNDLTPELAQKLLKGEPIAADTIRWTNSPKKAPIRRFIVLQKHFLRLYSVKAQFDSGARPLAYVFLDHSTHVLKRTETSLEIRQASDQKAPVTILEFESGHRLNEFKTVLEASLNELRKQLGGFLSYFSQKKIHVEPPPQPTIAQPSPVVDNNSRPQVPVVAMSPKPKEESTIKQDEKQQLDVAEDVDPRPVVELRARWIASNPPNEEQANGEKKFDEEEEVVLGTIHLDLNEPIVYARDEIYSQISPDEIPPRFSFVRVPDALRAQLMPKMSNFTSLTSAQEEEVLIKDCLISKENAPVNSSGVLLLKCARELVLKTEDWETERRAYKQIIMHLEAQLAEARRLLNEKARAMKRGEELSESRSHIFQALATLQRDGFIPPESDLEEVEHAYLSVFYEEDALKAFAFSPTCPLRPVWRRLCNDPKKMRKYIEDLEKFVLRPYRIRKERLGAPFWTSSVLRDIRFMEDSSRFEGWAKSEPWCEDDAERYVYLSSKLFYKSETDEEYSILAKGVPTEPPAPKKKKTIAEISQASKEAFAKERPKSFMASQDAMEAMRAFQERKTKSARYVVTKARSGSSSRNVTSESGSPDGGQVSAVAPASKQEQIDQPAVPAKQTEEVSAARVDDVTSNADEQPSEQSNQAREGKQETLNLTTQQENSLSKTSPEVSVSSTATHTTGTSPASSPPVESNPELPPNKPSERPISGGQTSNGAKAPQLPPGKPSSIQQRRASELSSMTDAELREFIATRGGTSEDCKDKPELISRAVDVIHSSAVVTTTVNTASDEKDDLDVL